MSMKARDHCQAAAFALGVVLVASQDWMLVVEGVPEPICAKSSEVCEAARRAIRAGWWPIGGVPADAATACRPSPNCFSYESDFIAGHNLPGAGQR